MHSLIAWFARNDVAANLLMVLIMALGAYTLIEEIPYEVYPEFDQNVIVVNVAYPGATPAEIEEGIAIRVEEAIQTLEGIERLVSESSEGLAQISVEVEKDYDVRALLDDVKARVDGISIFPVDAERPVISIQDRTHQVIGVTVYGDVSERELRDRAEQVRDDLLKDSEISHVRLDAVRPYEIAIEVSKTTLREFGLTLGEVATAVQGRSLNLSGGSIKTSGGEILIRANGQVYRQRDLENIPVKTNPDGTRILLGEIATIRDGYDEDLVLSRFNERPAITLSVDRVGKQSALQIAQRVRTYIDEQNAKLPPEIRLEFWRDRSETLKARINTLTSNALQGGVLVMLLLTLFLRPTIAFWVSVGIPISMLGGLMVMPLLDVSINIISLFGFIMVLGIVVDDAIVTSENIYSHLSRAEDPLQAVIKGTQEVSIPITFGMLTMVVAFLPLAFMEGPRGRIFEQLPLVMIPVILFSWIETKLILPAHLKTIRLRSPGDEDRSRFLRVQRKMADGFEAMVMRFYRPLLKRVLEYRYLSLAIIFAVFVIILSLVLGGWTRFLYFPRVQSEVANAKLELPAGTSFAVTDQYVQLIAKHARELREQHRDPVTGESLIIDIISTTGSSGGLGKGRSNEGSVSFEIVPPELRTSQISSSDLVSEWRKNIGQIPGAETLQYRSEIGRTGDPIDVQLTGQSFARLREVADLVQQRLETYPDIFDIADSLSSGKEELQLTIKPKAETLGLNLGDVAAQVRRAFYGFEVQRFQRGNDEVTMMVRFPPEERSTLATLDTMMIRTAAGVEVPFGEVADLAPGVSPTTITRIDRRRTLNVTADINKETANIEAIKRDLVTYMDELMVRYPDIDFSLEGEAKEQRDSFGRLSWGMVFVFVVMYGLLAIPFRSYVQPIIVMSVIPVGMIGAVVGHWIMGLELTIMSASGMLALMGIVVNDSLVLVDYVNQMRHRGMSIEEAVNKAGVVRFRAVFLTSATTFVGTFPLIFDKSTQAQFLIPMAVSVGFGVLFTTFVTLLMVPVNYMVLEDVKKLFSSRQSGNAPSAYQPE